MSGSWYISRLIKDAIPIRSGNIGDWGIAIDFLCLGEEETLKLHADDSDLFLNDDYNNLLLLEKKIGELYNQGNLSSFELSVLKEMSLSKSKQQLVESLGKDYKTIMVTFDRLTEMLGFILGGEFTNEGYLAYIAKKYNLDQEQVRKLQSFMNYKGIK
jgi:hypothetical protein